MSEFKSMILSSIAAGVEAVLPNFDERTGRFLTEPAGPIAPGATEQDLYWIVTNQDIMYALATCYLEPGTIFHGDERILEIACRAADAVRDFQYPDGRVEFVKPDGSKWGPTYMGWTNYAWLETYALLRDRIDPARRARWEEGLVLAHEGQAAEIRGLHVHNIPCWKAMSCHRAGQLFDRADWMQAGQAMMAAVVEAQQPGGYWAEHGGPSTSYNHVYVHGLGLYHVFSGDESVLPALEAAAEFHQTFTYPDGTDVETVDGRVTYHRRVNPSGLVSLSLVPKGRRFARYLLELDVPGHDLRACAASHMVSAYYHLREGDEQPINLDEPGFRKVYHDWAIVWRERPWFAALSAFVCPPVGSRWGQDRQNFLSLWHEDAGLLIGGGNSKDRPEWSSFIADGRFVPDSGGIAEDGRGVTLTYGNVRCTIALEVEPSAVSIEGRAEGGSAVQQLLLRVRKDQELSTAAGARTGADETAVDWAGADIGDWLQFGGCRISVPPGARFRWPTTPFNPYAIDGAPPYGSEMGVLSAPIDGKPVRWTVRMET